MAVSASDAAILYCFFTADKRNKAKYRERNDKLFDVVSWGHPEFMREGAMSLDAAQRFF
jgi:hypothetical protein